MTTLGYPTTKLAVHRLAGTPHVRGSKQAVGQLRKALHQLAAVLANSGWADDHPLDDDKVALDLIELVNHLGTAEAHSLRIAASALVRITERNGYRIA
jgi:hypothetical protein